MLQEGVSAQFEEQMPEGTYVSTEALKPLRRKINQTGIRNVPTESLSETLKTSCVIGE